MTRATLARFRRCERGATAIEYGMVASLIAMALVVAVAAAGGSLEKTFHRLEAALPQSGQSGGGGPPPDSGNGNGNNGNGNGNGGPNGNGGGNGNGNGGGNGNGNGNGGGNGNGNGGGNGNGKGGKGGG
jgi:Flp pilus assembly pilin Flp